VPLLWITVLLFVYCILSSNNPVANSSQWHSSTIISQQFSSSSHIRVTSVVHFHAPYTQTTSQLALAIKRSDGHATWTQAPYHILKLAWFLSSVCISSFIVQSPNRLEVDFISLFLRRVKSTFSSKSSTWRHSKSESSQISWGWVTPTIPHLAKVIGLLYLYPVGLNMGKLRVRVYPWLGSWDRNLRRRLGTGMGKHHKLRDGYGSGSWNGRPAHL